MLYYRNSVFQKCNCQINPKVSATGVFLMVVHLFVGLAKSGPRWILENGQYALTMLVQPYRNVWVLSAYSRADLSLLSKPLWHGHCNMLLGVRVVSCHTGCQPTQTHGTPPNIINKLFQNSEEKSACVHGWVRVHIWATTNWTGALGVARTSCSQLLSSSTYACACLSWYRHGLLRFNCCCSDWRSVANKRWGSQWVCTSDSIMCTLEHGLNTDMRVVCCMMAHCEPISLQHHEYNW